jgi:cellulose synthase/poly-beta-1,6-N-acetylglucosamine synthase-like glycosyltransferase
MSESRFRSSVGATGAFYAIRRVLWHDLPSDTLIDDFVTPMRVVHQGYDVKLEPRAVIYDELQTRVRGEFKRKVRTLMGNYQAMVREPWLFTAANPIRLQWLSHKVARLVLPYFLVVMLVSSYFLPGAGFRAFFFAQVLVYAIGLVGNFAPRLARVPLVGFIMTFTALKAASVVSLWRYAIRNVDSRWEKT